MTETLTSAEVVAWLDAKCAETKIEGLKASVYCGVPDPFSVYTGWHERSVSAPTIEQAIASYKEKFGPGKHIADLRAQAKALLDKADALEAAEDGEDYTDAMSRMERGLAEAEALESKSVAEVRP
jgi:hypothetical protein